MKILRRVAGVASKAKEIIGNLITTAGKVVVTILLGLTGRCFAYLASGPFPVVLQPSSTGHFRRHHSNHSGYYQLCPLPLRSTHCASPVPPCVPRYHAPLADLSSLLLCLPGPVHLVVLLQDVRHAHIQLHVRAHGHLQRRTPHRALPLPVPVLPGGHSSTGQLHQVRPCGRNVGHMHRCMCMKSISFYVHW